jgi:hypothetical protein
MVTVDLKQRSEVQKGMHLSVGAGNCICPWSRLYRYKGYIGIIPEYSGIGYTLGLPNLTGSILLSTGLISCHSRYRSVSHALVKSIAGFLLKVTRFPRFVQGRKWLNGAKSKSYLVNRLPFSEPSCFWYHWKSDLSSYIPMPSILCDIWEML